MTVAVLNPGGRDPDQIFANGAGAPGDAGHPPVNYHAYAACCHGGFFRDIRSVPPQTKFALVLLRQRNLRQALAAVQTLGARGCRVAISCKESGSHQVAALLGDAGRLRMFQEICRAAGQAVSSTPEMGDIYRNAGCTEVEFVPTPYPVDSPAWDFGQPLEKRSGIFVGTREVLVPSRNHLAAVLAADHVSRDLKCRVTVVNGDGRRGAAILAVLQQKNPMLDILALSATYPDYLRAMSCHRIVWQLDASAVPGQVAGDALLCRMPCLGGNGAIDTLAFPDFCPPAPRDSLVRSARSLLTDDAAWKAAVEKSQSRATSLLGFAVTAARLGGHAKGAE